MVSRRHAGRRPDAERLFCRRGVAERSRSPWDCPGTIPGHCARVPASRPEAAMLDSGDTGATAACGTLGASCPTCSSASPQFRKAQANRRSLADSCRAGCAGRVLFSWEEGNRARRARHPRNAADGASNRACTEAQSRGWRTNRGSEENSRVPSPRPPPGSPRCFSELKEHDYRHNQGHCAGRSGSIGQGESGETKDRRA